MGDHRISYLDGLRGLLAIIVFVHHFLYAFCPGVVFGGDYETFLSGHCTAERIFALTPINILFNPGTAINFFFLLSGYVQCLPYFLKQDLFLVQKNFIKRYFRLALPTLAVVLMVFAFQHLLLIDKSHFPPNPLTHEWIQSMMPNTLTFFQTLRYGLFDCFNSKSQNYQVLWTMPVELYNSWMVLILLMLTHRLKTNWVFLHSGCLSRCSFCKVITGCPLRLALYWHILIHIRPGLPVFFPTNRLN